MIVVVMCTINTFTYLFRCIIIMMLGLVIRKVKKKRIKKKRKLINQKKKKKRNKKYNNLPCYVQLTNYIRDATETKRIKITLIHPKSYEIQKIASKYVIYLL